MVNQHMHLARRPLATVFSLLSLAALGASLTVAFADLVSPVVEAAESAQPIQVIQQRVQEARQAVQESLEDVYATQQIVQQAQSDVQVAQQAVQDAQPVIQAAQQDVQEAVQVAQASAQAVQELRQQVQAVQQEAQQVEQAIEQAPQATQEPSPAVQQDAAPSADEAQVAPTPLLLAQATAQDIDAQPGVVLSDAIAYLNNNQYSEARDSGGLNAQEKSMMSSQQAQLFGQEESYAAAAQAKLSQDPVPLARTHPDYPKRALQLGLEGWVKVRYSVDPTGAVVDAVIVDSKPRRVFDEAAIDAVSHWQYDPKIEDGVPVQYAGAETTFRFTLADSR